MKNKEKVIKIIWRYVVITFGCFSLAAGISLFLDPNKLAPGGISGIAIILSRFVPVSTGMLILIMNVPLLILGLVKFGKEFLFSTVYATIVQALAVDLISYIFGLFGIEKATSDLFLAAVFGGILSAIGLGLVFRCNCTTGGLDIIVKILHTKYRHLGMGSIYLVVDFLIAAVSAAVFKDIDVALYACVGIIIYIMLTDLITYGGNGAKFLYIISNDPAPIKKRILTELEIGVTDIEGEGAYTGEKKKIIMCAVRKDLYPQLRDIVREEDPTAFMIVNTAKEVYGLGFRDHHEEL